MMTMKTAAATIGPTGLREAVPRTHLIKITINLGGGDDGKQSHRALTDVARRALSAWAPAGGEPDRREFREVSVSRKGKAGAVTSVVVAVEGSVVCPDRPLNESIEAIRSALVGEGYRATVQERRECSEGSCSAEAFIDWKRQDDVPARWFSNLICGQHGYRRCARCESVYLLASSNSAGQAPSVHCEVCGLVLIEWGSSKIWTATLVSRGHAPAS
jgi:hypothetical protein